MLAYLQRLLDRYLLWIFLKGFTGRVRVGAVRESMRQTGLGLFKGGFFSKGGGAACPLAQLVRVIEPQHKFASSGVVLHTFPKLDDAYVYGFTMGYDLGFLLPENPEFNSPPRTKRYMNGYRDGGRIRKELLEAPRVSNKAELADSPE